MNKTYRPRVSIDMDVEDARFLSDILPYGQRMSILRLIIKDFIAELRINPDILEDLLTRHLPRTRKIAVKRSLLQTILETAKRTPQLHPLFNTVMQELEELLK